MRLSEDRISWISRLIVNGLTGEGLVELLQPEEKLYREVKKTITAELQGEDEVDMFVRKKIQSMSRKLPEGSAEWTVLYRKFMDEEMGRRKKV